MIIQQLRASGVLKKLLNFESLRDFWVTYEKNNLITLKIKNVSAKPHFQIFQKWKRQLFQKCTSAFGTCKVYHDNYPPASWVHYKKLARANLCIFRDDNIGASKPVNQIQYLHFENQ